MFAPIPFENLINAVQPCCSEPLPTCCWYHELAFRGALQQISTTSWVGHLYVSRIAGTRQEYNFSRFVQFTEACKFVNRLICARRLPHDTLHGTLADGIATAAIIGPPSKQSNSANAGMNAISAGKIYKQAFMQGPIR